MPKIAIEIPEAHENITRPVVKSAIEAVKKLTRIDDTVREVYNGDAEQALQPGSELTFEGQKDVRMQSESTLLVTSTEEFIEENVLPTAVHRYENVVVFADHALDVAIKPVYTRNRVSLNFTYRTRDRTTAHRWRHGLRRKVSEGRFESLQEIRYHYPLPLEFLVILYQIHAYRENVAGYGETLQTWLMNHFSESVTALTNQAGDNPLLVIGEKQIGVMGWFDFTAAPDEPEKDQETGTYSTSFNYVLEFDRVTSCVMHYPLVVHNQLLNQRIRGKEVPYSLEQYFTTPSWSRVLFDSFSSRYPGAGMAVPGLAIPYYDDWLPIQWPPFSTPLLRVLLQVDPDDLQAVLSLDGLGDYEIEPLLLDWLKTHPAGIEKNGGNLLRLTLYEGRKPAGGLGLTMDEALAVRTVEDLSLRKPYHLVISLLHDPSILSPAFTEELRNHGELCLLYLRTLQPDLEERGLLPKLIGNNYVPKYDYQKAVQYISQTMAKQYRHPERQMMTVGNFLIAAKDKE